MAVNPTIPWTLRQAIDRGFEWYPIEITDFGNAALAPFNENGVNITPISNFPVRGARIAADSPAARCVLEYNAGQQINSVGRGARPNQIILTHEQPFFGTLTAPLFAQAPFDAMFFDTYTLEDGVATAAFGGALPATVWFPPNVKLELLLRGNGISAVKRQVFELVNFTSPALTGGGTEDLIRVVPLDGRKHVRIAVTNRAASANTIDYRITLVNMRSTTGLGPFVQRSTEAEVVAPITVAVGSTDTVTIDNPNSQYLLLKVLSPAASFTFDYTIRLED